MKKNYHLLKTILFIIGVIAAGSTSAQCPTITCPANITVNNDPGSCDTLITYTAPIGTDPCASTNSQTFNYTGSLQTFTVPAGVNSINIDTRGAQGGSVNVACNAFGGLGARMIGDFSVTPGQVLSVMVGQTGFTNNADGGGGGGTFVVAAGNVPLIVAGGGGGASNNIGNCGSNLNGIDASVTTSGTASGDGLVAGGTAGNGGGASSGSGGGGGGFNTDGTGGTGTPTSNGKAYINGGIGGTGNSNDHGGYGGGGAGWYTGGNGGGGGGYSGGGTSGAQPFTGGGGGGSYNSGTNIINTAGFQTGDGQAIISWAGGVTISTSLASGLGSGSAFPIGVTTEEYLVINSLGDSATCSFTITVTGPVVTIDPFVLDTICLNNATVTLPAATPTGGTYSGTGVTANTFDPSLSGTGTFWVTYTDSTGCGADSTSITVDPCTGISENKTITNLSVFPNPNNGQFSLNISTTNTGGLEVKIIDVHGKVIYLKSNFEKKPVINEKLNLSDHAKGIYFIIVKSDMEVITKKLILR